MWGVQSYAECNCTKIMHACYFYIFRVLSFQIGCSMHAECMNVVSATCMSRRKRGTWHCALIPRKFKRGICRGGHLAITYGGELLNLLIFSYIVFCSYSLPNNFVRRELPFRCGLKSRTHIGYCTVNHAVTIMCPDRAEWLRQILRYNNSSPYMTGNTAAAP